MPAVAAEKKALSPPAAKSPGIVATVNGSEIATEDFTRELARVERLIVNTGKPLTCPQISQLRTEVIEGMIRQELLYQEGKKSVKVSEGEISGEVKKRRDQYGSDADFEKALGLLKLTPASFRANVERTLSVQKFVETQFIAKADVTDQEVRAYYDRNRDSFRQPELVKASHILIKAEAGNEAKNQIRPGLRIPRQDLLRRHHRPQGG
jgi:peptidyl-prolyl cis-trans isomerase C